MTDRVFSTEQLAERYGVTELTLTDWRYHRRGPRWFKAGKRVFYREEAVLAWEKEQEALQQESA